MWRGTLIDFLKINKIPSKDRIWVATRFLDDKTNRLFAVWCARQALKLVNNPDTRSIEACNVAEKFALCEATRQELASARAAASNAARAAASNAASNARAVTWAATSDTAWAAIWAASSDAAWAAQVKHLIEMVENE